MELTQMLLALSIALFAGLMLSRVAKLLQLPAPTAWGCFACPALALPA